MKSSFKKNIFLLLVVLLFPIKIYGGEYYYLNNKDKFVKVIGKDNETNLESLLESEHSLMPENTKLIWEKKINTDLYVNFSDEILNMGGTYHEARLVNQIVKTCVNEDIETVTIFIEGEIRPLNEGTTVFRVKFLIEDL